MPAVTCLAPVQHLLQVCIPEPFIQTRAGGPELLLLCTPQALSMLPRWVARCRASPQPKQAS